MKGMSGAEANAVGGGWEVEEPRCEWLPADRDAGNIQRRDIRVLCAAGATEVVKSK